MTATSTVPTTTTTKDPVPMRNPKDSMKSTWREDKTQWKLPHYLIEMLHMSHYDLNVQTPVHAKTDKLPYIPHFQNHRFVLFHAFWPLVLHQLYFWYTGHNPHALVILVFYAIAFKINGIHELHILRRLGQKYGFFDGDKHERDGVPDHAVGQVFQSLALTSTLRPIISLMLAWDSTKSPLSISPWILLEIGLYSIVLDFWFYWYHRAMHHFEHLWKYHRTHHLTKHPNPLLTLYADMEQEIFDIMVIPLLAYGTMKLMGLPMGFYDWWICHMYVVYIELWGHSGVRIYSTPPSTLNPILAYFDMELTVEDHDLHHRKGWKKSHNYGKQTRVWDRIFNTCTDRIECLPEAIDYTDLVTVPVL